ncbi:hypothetical protein P7K49_002336 [Saguinus oedipus]|uniref:Uncharacterized protein n=1 Tax=Saguinus oedipus TaxID=9490 RepID=A0ABQ9WH21_SAGOE|nr:hypothetical protein P7K49_002336 [Saguinus oedipus]
MDRPRVFMETPEGAPQGKQLRTRQSKFAEQQGAERPGSVANAIETPVQDSALGVREAAPGAGRRGAGPGRGGAPGPIRSRAGPRAADSTPPGWVADAAIIAAAAR